MNSVTVPLEFSDITKSAALSDGRHGRYIRRDGGGLITYLTAKVLIDPVTTIKTDMKILNCGESTFIKLNIVKRNDQ